MPRLLILLALLAGVLYSLHLLVLDYQALTAASKVLRFLFKRDVSQNYSKPNVRWKRILRHDPIQCARYFYCDLGARPANNEVREGFIFMLSLDPKEEDRQSYEAFIKAFQYGRLYKEADQCKTRYPLCPFDSSLLFHLIQYLLHDK